MKILFLDLSTKLKTIHDLQTQARGGMVSSLFAVSDGLARMGHKTAVISDISEGGYTAAGTEWLTRYEGQKYDVLVCNRGVGAGYPEIRADKRVLWTHDLPHNGFIANPNTIKAFSATVFMSNYAEKVWRSFYPTIGKSFTIPNGIDKETFYPRTKNFDYMIYISNPNRGLERLPLIYEAIKTKLKRDIKLRAYSNSAILHPNEHDDPGYNLKYKKCVEAGIELLDPIPQKQLAHELGTAGIMILPTQYPEICSNAVLQSLACGTPIITTGNLGSACEWIKHGKNGMLTKFYPHDYMIYQLEMVRNTIYIMQDNKLHKKMSHKAAKTKNINSWPQIVKKWDQMLRWL